jgi:DNA-binding NtrC family response regulator
MALRASSGVKSRAARALGISERMLAYKMKTYGLDAGAKGPAAPGQT